MRFFLDLTNAVKPKFWKDGDPLMLPCETGTHHLDYDIIESELPADFVAKMRECTLRVKDPEQVRRHGDFMEQAPVGFRHDSIADNGAELIET